MAHEPVVWIIDEEQWPRACLRAELIERGYDAVGFFNVDHALTALDYSYAPRPWIAVLELRGIMLKEEEVERLIQYAIPVVILGGSVEINGKWVREHEWAAVMQRPFTIGEVADKVERLLASQRR